MGMSNQGHHLLGFQDASHAALELAETLNASWGKRVWRGTTWQECDKYGYAATMGTLYVIPLEEREKKSGYYRGVFGSDQIGVHYWSLVTNHRDPLECAKEQYELVEEMHREMSAEMKEVTPRDAVAHKVIRVTQVDMDTWKKGASFDTVCGFMNLLRDPNPKDEETTCEGCLEALAQAGRAAGDVNAVPSRDVRSTDAEPMDGS